MRVRLRFFAMLREKVGTAVERDARAGATIAAVWRAFVAEHPEVARVQVRFAVDETYVEPSHRLADGDEVAVFPPVSGGSEGLGTPAASTR
jgi:molybdopterin converting factor subunit 1